MQLMGRNKYEVVMFTRTGALAVCVHELQDRNEERIYAFAVKRRVMRYFEVGTWKSAVTITDERSQYAIDEFICWSKTEGVNDDTFNNRQKARQSLIDKRLREEIKNKQDIIEALKQHNIYSLWHITHKNNVEQILRYGILNHYNAHGSNVNSVDISDPEAQKWREDIDPHYKRKIHDYAPLYIKPRNPMLYKRHNIQCDLCLLEISLSVLMENECLITDGNAASRITKFFKSANHINNLPWDVLNSAYWPDHEDGKRKMCAEVLIYPEVSKKFIERIHCCSMNTKNYLATFGCVAALSRNLFF